jgi:hypothetical protein
VDRIPFPKGDIMQDAKVSDEVDLESVLDGIIAGLDDASEKYPREAIAAARRHRDAVIPRLIAAIDRDVDQVIDKGEVTGHAGFYAVYLLAEFRATEALPSILRSLACDDDQLWILFSDGLTEDFQYLLADLVDDIAVADRLIADPSLYWTIRSLGMSLYSQFVFLGKLSRSQAVERLRTHLRNVMAQQDWETTTWLIGELVDLAATEALDEIREAYRLNLVDETVIGDFTDVEADLSPPTFAKTLQQIAEKRQKNLVDGIADWAWYTEKSSRPLPIPHCSPRTDEDYDDFGELVLPKFDNPAPVGTIRNVDRPTGRNDPCPCGSGRKFKKCCGGN